MMVTSMPDMLPIDRFSSAISSRTPLQATQIGGRNAVEYRQDMTNPTPRC